MTPTPQPYTLLVVDPCSDTQARIVAQVQGRGFSVIAAPTAAAALDKRVAKSSSEFRLTMNSNPAYIPGVISWLLNGTAWMLSDVQQLRLRGALQELLLNAVEHGNLEMFYQRKQQAVAEGWYEELLSQRLADPRFRNLHVIVRVYQERTVKHLSYRIADEGNGFAWRKYLAKPVPSEARAVSGRGILLARWLFPTLGYNKVGNEVTFTVPFA